MNKKEDNKKKEDTKKVEKKVEKKEDTKKVEKKVEKKEEKKVKPAKIESKVDTKAKEVKASSKEKNKKDGHYITGILGALLGAIIFVIPWITVYSFANLNLVILAALIPIAAFFGYKICKGKMNNKLSIIVSIISVLIYAIGTFIVIPILLNVNAGNNFGFEMFDIYSNEVFRNEILQNFGLGLLFIFPVLFDIIMGVRKQVENKSKKIRIIDTKDISKEKLNAIKIFKPIFEKFEATSRDKGIIKQDLLVETNNSEARNLFKILSITGLIKKYKGKYYYTGEEKKKTFGKFLYMYGISIISGIIIIALGIAFAFLFPIKYSIINTNTITDENITYKISSKWEEYKSNSETSASSATTKEKTYYLMSSKYTEAYNAGTTNTISSSDYQMYPSMIDVQYDLESGFSSADELKTTIEAYISGQISPDEQDSNLVTTKNGDDLISVRMKFNSDPEEVVYFYYIFKDGKCAYITVSIYNVEDENEVSKDTLNLINSFKWNN